MASAVRRSGSGLIDDSDDPIRDQRALAAVLGGSTQTPQAAAWDETTARGGVTGPKVGGLQIDATTAPTTPPGSPATPPAPSSKYTPHYDDPNFAVPTAFGADTDWTNADNVRAYYASQNLKPYGGDDVSYWTNKAQEFGDNGLLWDKLQQNDESLGRPANYDWTKGMSNGGGANYLESSTVPLDSEFFNQLMKQMRGGGGQAVVDNKALASVMR